MKNLATALLLSLFAVTATAQNTIIVDNNPNGIGQYTTLSAAITAAQAGDIVMLIPSATSYGDLTMTSTGKRLTIAGGGYNGPVGRVTTLGVVSLNGGSAVNTNLDGFVIGGVAVTSIDVNFVDNVKIKAVRTADVIASTNYQLRVRNSAGAEVEYITTTGATGGMNFTGNSNLKLFHIQGGPVGSIAAIEIATTTNFIVSNSVFTNVYESTGDFVTVDATSTGMFQNCVFMYTTGRNRVMNFGGAVSLTNNLFHYNNAWPYQGITLQGGQTWQHNSYDASGQPVTYYSYPAGLVILNASNLTDANQNRFATIGFRSFDQNALDLRLLDNSSARDSGSGNDVDGTTADRGIFGGLDPMPAILPREAVGISVVPSVTSINLSLPTAATGGQIILKATGKSKKN